METREIKFRGKRTTTGEWVYGYLTEIFTYAGHIQRYAIDTCQQYDADGISIDIFEIISKTRGQYTGLHDKNGVEIYEGDIVSMADPVLGGRVTVEMVYAAPSFMVKFVPSLNSPIISISDLWTFSDGEVIGNKFENPELVEM